MISILNQIFYLDSKLRTFIRFVSETLLFLTIYFLWNFIFDPFERNLNLETYIHVFNLSTWFLLYKFFNLGQDQLRFSSLFSYFSIIKLSLSFSVIIAIEYLAFFDPSKFLTSILVFLFLSNTMIGIRIIARQYIRYLFAAKKRNVLVYGTSDIAIDLVNALAFSKKYKVVGFVLDGPSKNQRQLAGLPVIKLKDINDFCLQKKTKLIVLASEQTPNQDKDFLQHLDNLGLSVAYAPTMDRAFDYEVQLKSVRPEELLGREAINNNDARLKAEIVGRNILITGAGGSIGSEICRQLLRYNPDKLFVLDISEFALYSLEQELSQIHLQKKLSTEIEYYLGSVTDESILNKIFNSAKINVVYHAAAYKHVPIIENNIISGIKNNVSGTRLTAEKAAEHGVQKFILVSTDKAVRPTNVMGATKRLAELICQTLFDDKKTIFSSVRFGNVLGSSGSVIPKFKSQIKSGGPVTVTHEEITRYFMSIPEAAHLVLSASNLAKGGEVFLLDMGEPIKILDLAKSMVRHHGLRPLMKSDLKNRNKAEEEILIDLSGLRKGEKLYEELLVGSAAQKTADPKVFFENEMKTDKKHIITALETLEILTENHDSEGIISFLKKLPIAYLPLKQEKKVSSKGPKDNRYMVNSSERKPLQYVKKHQEEPIKKSISQKFLCSKPLSFLLHKYFWLYRGMTLGVRIAIVNSEKKILLVRHSYMPGWYFPGGGVEHGETIYDAAYREVYQETGIDDLFDLKLIKFELNEEVSNKDHVAILRAETSSELIKQTSLEIKEAKFYDFDKLPTDLHVSVKKVLKENFN